MDQLVRAFTAAGDKIVVKPAKAKTKKGTRLFEHGDPTCVGASGDQDSGGGRCPIAPGGHMPHAPSCRDW